MLIGDNSKYFLKLTNSKAKMYEFFVPEEEHIIIEKEVSKLFLNTLAILGDYSVAIIEDNKEDAEQLTKELEFSASFFESYIHGKFDKDLTPYLYIIGSATYYLCNKQGNSKVMINNVKETINIGGYGLETLMVLILKNHFSIDRASIENLRHSALIKEYLVYHEIFVNSGEFQPLIDFLLSYRQSIYSYASPRELLFIDIIIAITKLKMNSSAIVLLPQYTGISYEQWKPTLLSDTFIRELWSSQVELGIKNVYRGKSAVIQMPTSSGKTKSIEIIIRSAFMSNRAKFAVIVAPFRALCREISTDLRKSFVNENININELSDVLRNDYTELKEGENSIIIVTPEKLIYLIRKFPDIINDIGLIIFDEGHLFDDPHRGIVYELLVTTIKTYLKDTTQKILISAVISNADKINNWLNNDAGEVITAGGNLTTEKNIAFIERTLFSREKYSLHFVEQSNIEIEKYYVPKVVSTVRLDKLRKETKERSFPSKESINKDIGINLAIKLCNNGGVVIFCGRKDSAKGVLERILDIDMRGYDISNFLNVCDRDEVKKIHKLFVINLGSDNPYSKACEKGVFSHHSNVPEGIKSSIEFAMRSEKIRVVVCTSTLAQGVNLPIRYLIIPSIYQSGEEIEVRDFHNLIGRTGRAGMYTEGSILFTEPGVYKQKQRHWKWFRYVHLINYDNAKPCESIILKLVQPKKEIQPIFQELIDEYINGSINIYIIETVKYIDDLNIDEKIKEQIKSEIYFMISILSEIENFLMSNIKDDEKETSEIITSIIGNSFAFFLANEEEKKLLHDIINRLYIKVTGDIDDCSKIRRYGRTLLSLDKLIIIENWIKLNLEELQNTTGMDELVMAIFPILMEITSTKEVDKMNDKTRLIELYKLWINGESYYKILQHTERNGLKIKARTKYNAFTLDNVISICNNVFGYNGSIVVSAIQELVESFDIGNEILDNLFDELSRRSRYGLKSIEEVLLYEMGFNDRYIVSKIRELANITSPNRNILKGSLKLSSELLFNFLGDYPDVYVENLKTIVKSEA